MSKLGCLALRFQWNGPIAGPAAAETMGLPLVVSLLEFGASEADYRAAIESVSHDGANAIMVVDPPDVFRNSTLIVRLVGESRLPSMFTFFEPFEAGGLMAYSFDVRDVPMH
jgi:putative ABC transport system substrate-binding protein